MKTKLKTLPKKPETLLAGGSDAVAAGEGAMDVTDEI
jgi:hypothetical protein